MIDYETFCKIRLSHRERGLTLAQIAHELGIHPQTVAKYLALGSYHPRRPPRRTSKLDPFKPTIQRWLERYPYSATQILQRLQAEEGYQGGFSILKDYVRLVRPVRKPAFLTLAFAPGECAQVDWGCAGALQIASTRRRLSFFVMVLCHSRMIYIEFSLGEAKKRPIDLFAEERPHLKPLPPLPADTSATRSVRVTNRCRVVLDTNRYSVPALYASARLTLKLFADRLCIYHGANLVATHPRSYERHRDFENPDHIKELLDQRRKARDAKLLLRFYSLSPRAEDYHRQLAQRRLNPRTHINKIVALADIYGEDNLARATQDAFDSEAFSSEYIANILEQRLRLAPQPGPLHLTRRADLLDVDLGPADLSPY